MTTLRHTLQQEVFQPNEERLLSVCHVSKLLKKKKTSHLCIVSNMNPPFGISIVQLKQTDKAFKKKRTWELPELKTMDGIHESSETHQFDLHLDKVYRWFASNVQERQVFIITLYKQCTKHIAKDKPTFKNIQNSWITEDILTPEKFVSSPILGVESIEISEDFQALTEKEENDITKLMAGCEFAISNAEAFMEVLARDLSLLDGENVQCVLASEKQVEALMEQMESAIAEAERVEQRLDAYDEILCHVRETMEKMEKKNSVIEVANKNNILLYNELKNIVDQLDLAHEHQLVLIETDLTSPQGLAAAIKAGNALKDAMNCQLNPALLRMSAVQEQKKRFEKYKDKFSHSICRQLNNLFIHLGNDKGEPAVNSLTLPQHGSVHRELLAYSELMHWSKIMDRKAYLGLRKVYTDSLGKLYDRDLRALFEAARDTVAVPGQATTPTKSSVALLGIDQEQWSTEVTSADRKKYDDTLEQVLSQLEPVFMQEQAFCVSFFHLDVLSPSMKNTLTTLDGVEGEVAVVPHKKAEKQMNEEVRGMMSDLFSCLEEELIGFIAHLEKQDSFYCMYVLVRLNQHVMSAQSSYLSNCFGSVLIMMKRSLDRFMQQQVDSVRECRVPRRSKCGILPYVYNLEEFARCADVLLRSDRRADLEKWYIRLVDIMLESIGSYSSDHHKTPQQVIKMENYHHLYSLLSQLKITVLDAQRKEAKQRYNDALAAYVKEYFGRPLEKLNQFFDGVQSRVAGGVKISEVGYQLAFSKQELRKVIQQYPGSTVKKGVEALYRKVEKHLSEEGNLLQVVWRAMQEEFIGQYKNLEELIQRCYPGSMITLDFTIENILQYFSEIARSH